MAVTFSLSSATTSVGVQTAYEQNLTIGHEGMLADITDNTVITGINETDAVLPFGVLVVQDAAGTAGNAVKTVVSDSAVALGIAVDSFAFETTKDSNDRPGYPDNQPVNVLTEGTIIVYSEEAVGVGDAVYVRTVASGTNYAGRFRKTSVSGKTSLVGNAQFVSKTSGAGLALVQVNGPRLTLTAN